MPPLCGKRWSRSCAWHVETVDRPDPSRKCVLVLDESAFARAAPPLSNPERVVLITRKDPQLLAQAWEAGIVSVVSEEDPISTVLLAIMAGGTAGGEIPRRRCFGWNIPQLWFQFLRQ